MAMTQLSAVSGRRVLPDYRSRIEAQAPYVLALQRQKDQDKYNAANLALAEKGVQQDYELGQGQLALGRSGLDVARQKLEEEKAQARRAERAGIANTGLTLGFGIAEHGKDILGSSDGATEGARQALSTATKDSVREAKAGDFFSGKLAGADSEPAVDGSSWGFDDLTSGLGDALGKSSTWAGLSIGPTVGPVLGEKLIPFGDDKTKQIVGSALVGGGVGAILSGGDPYVASLDALGSGLLGGLW